MQWVNSPEVMARFTQEDLEDMNKNKLGVRRGLKVIKKAEKKKEGKPEVSYVA